MKLLSSRFNVSTFQRSTFNHHPCRRDFTGLQVQSSQLRGSSRRYRNAVSIAYVATENIVVNVLSEAFHFIPFPTGDPSSDNNNNDQLPNFCYHLCTLLHFIYPIPFFNRSQPPFHLLVGTEPSSGFHYTESDCIK